MVQYRDTHFFSEFERNIFDILPGLAYYCKFTPSATDNPYDYSLVLQYASKGCMELVGVSSADFVKLNKNVLEHLMTEDDAKRTHNYCYDQVSKKQSYEMKYRIKLANGLLKWVWDIGTGDYDEDGNIIGYKGIIMDISEEKFNELELQEENKQLKASIEQVNGLGRIIGKSKAMQNVYELIMKASENDMNVIILGETGCGKDLVAKAIHEYSGKKGNYVPVNCGAIPEQLMESEFFGHTKGSFSGAYANKEGFIAAANNGTLFLDEIGEIPLNLQVKLLRTLENRTYTPLGSNSPKTSNFRLIVATHRDLHKMVQEKNMRSDFFYRINVLEINLPPLRERENDLFLLIDDYFKQKNANITLPLKVRLAMQNYQWPGNVRELHNFLDKYLFLGEDALKSLHFSDEDNFLMNLTTNTLSFKEATEEFEKQIITKSLSRNNGNTAKCAESLDMNIRTLQRKIKQYGIK